MTKGFLSCRRDVLALGVLALALACLPAAPVQACPWCGENLPTGQSGDPNSLSAPGSPNVKANLAAGFYYSILLMISVPYLALGGLGFYIWSMWRKQHQVEPQAQGAPTPAQVPSRISPDLI